MGFLGILAIVPTAVLFTISFFVWYAVKRTEDASLRTYGWAAMIVLWVAAGVVFTTGVLAVSGGGPFCHKAAYAQMHHGGMGGNGMIWHGQGMMGRGMVGQGRLKPGCPNPPCPQAQEPVTEPVQPAVPGKK